MAVTPPTNPAEAFPKGDPRNANYWANLAAYEHAYQTTLAGDKETLQNAKTGAQYQQTQLTKAEPGVYRTNQARANAGGIAESGINAQRRGNIASQYAQKRYTVQSGLQKTEGNLRKNDEGALYTRESNRADAANKALTEGYNALLKNPENEQTSGVNAHPGGYVPYSSSKVTVGPKTPSPPAPPAIVGVRKQAAAKSLAAKYKGF